MSSLGAEVLVQVDGCKTARHVLGPGAYTVGSSATAGVRIEAAHVSREHARLTIGPDCSLSIKDLGSTNGTYLNQRPITKPTSVAPQQSIGIGIATMLIQPFQAVEKDTAGDIPPELSRAVRYEPGEKIAKGGMGAILLARQPAIRREVALKVMLCSASAHDRLRFVEEAQITGQLEHPNIVPVHDLSINEHGQLYYAMKLVHGWTLKETLQRLAQGDRETMVRYPLANLLTIFQKSAMRWLSPIAGMSCIET